MEALREEVISNLRACLISTKGKCDLKTLRRDYQMLMGEQIPYVKLGHRTLEDFLCSIDSLLTTKGPNGEMMVDAVASQQSRHITDLINRQKASKKKKLPTRPIRHTSYAQYQQTPPPASKWRPKNAASNLRPAQYNSSPRPAAVAHSQFVSHPNQRPQHRQHAVPPRYQEKRGDNGVASDGKVSAVQNQETNKACSVLTNTKMRIVKKMNEISLDGNLEQQTSHRQSPGTPSPLCTPDGDLQRWNGSSKNCRFDPMDNFELTGNNIVDLETFIILRHLPQMTLKMMERKTNKGRVTLHECSIKVGNHSYSNYPTEFCDPEMSKQFTAKLALEDLMMKYSRRRSLLLSNDRDILERIPPMIEKHTNGIWNTQLEADYSDLYNEQLPSNWLEVVDVSPNVYVEPVLEKFILRYCRSGEVFQKGTKSFSPLVADVSVASNTVCFSENGELTAVVTCAVSAGEIWCRQIGTPQCEAFENMSVRLDEVYNKNHETLKADDVKEGGYFVVKGDYSWLRVRVLEVKQGEVECFCIDTGDECTTPVEQVYRLKREFAVEQAQVFVCRLAGLEALYECSKNSEHIQNLVGKAVVLEMADDASKNDLNDPSLAVVMYDTEARHYINQALIDQIAFETAAPVLKKDITEVYISHVEDNGDVYVQIRLSGFEQLKRLLDNLKSENPQVQSRIIPNETKNRLFFKKKDDEWYRVAFLDWAPNKQFAQIQYVDYGNWEVIPLKDEQIFPIDEISDVASSYPPQALKVRMALDKIPTNFKEKFEQLIPHDSPVLLKNLGKTDGPIPIVDFFKRSEADNILFSVTSALEIELKAEGDGNNNSNPSRTTKLQRLMSFQNMPSAGLLRAPPMPPIGEYFDVMVPCAVNPYNFFVQPYESNAKLDKLMSALQEKYTGARYTPPQIEEIQPGKIYASRHTDNLWYRTSVIKVIHAGSISVFYSDFGYYANLTRQQLVPLDPEFTELPYQAIKAKLVGIKPTHSKWTMEDCQFFQDLVVKRPFVSVLVSMEKDELYRSDVVLNLKLIDTMTSSDIHIDQVLVEKGIAVNC